MWLRIVLVVLGLAGAPQADAWADRIATRAGEHLDAAEAALVAGDLAAAERSIEMAWVYVRSPLFPSRPPAITERWRAAVRKLAAARLIPPLVAQRDEATALLGATKGAKRPPIADFDRAVAAAAACERAIAEAVDVDPEARFGGATLAELQASCRALTDAGLAARAEAERIARERDALFRKLLTGDRLAIYKEHGEPMGPEDATPAELARQSTWIYVHGPSGSLRTYTRWKFTFKGTRLVSRQRTISHESVDSRQ